METDEILETGYGAATPAGDNLCNDFAQGLIDAYASLATTGSSPPAPGGRSCCSRRGPRPIWCRSRSAASATRR